MFAAKAKWSFVLHFGLGYSFKLRLSMKYFNSKTLQLIPKIRKEFRIFSLADIQKASYLIAMQSEL